MFPLYSNPEDIENAIRNPTEGIPACEALFPTGKPHRDPRNFYALLL